MKLLTKINNGLARAEAFFLSILLMAMLILAFLQVVMRNAFNSGIPWADTVVRTLVLWVGFLGATLATKLDQHLTVEVLTKYLPEHVKHITAIVVKVFAIVVCYFLMMAACRFLKQESTSGEEFLHLFPAWYALLIIPMTFVLIPLHMLLSIIRDIRYFVKGTAE